jgi:anti-anti-sigma regulatory factor
MPTITSDCELEIERGPDWLLVRVNLPDSVGRSGPALADRIWRLLEQHFTYRLVLELDEVRVLTGDLIEQLMQLYRRIEEHEGVMRVCGLSPSNRQVLHACRLDEQLLPYRDREEAVMGVPHPR